MHARLGELGEPGPAEALTPESVLMGASAKILLTRLADGSIDCAIVDRAVPAAQQTLWNFRLTEEDARGLKDQLVSLLDGSRAKPPPGVCG